MLLWFMGEVIAGPSSLLIKKQRQMRFFCRGISNLSVRFFMEAYLKTRGKSLSKALQKEVFAVLLLRTWQPEAWTFRLLI